MHKMADKLIYTEKKGHVDTPSSYVYLSSSSCFKKLKFADDSDGGDGGGFWVRFLGWVREVFLPQGYPHSVSPDYFDYQVWDSLQAYSSSIAGALSLQATLLGLGVGEEGATPLAATLSWLLKDGSGMIASIGFAYWKGTQLDSNSKQWRMFADVCNDFSLFIHLIAPSLSIPFLPVLCVSGILTSFVRVAGAGTRAVLAVHQAKCNNMADVSAKDGSQETMVNLAALITNLTLLPYFTYNAFLTWVTFITCVLLHIYTNWRAMRALVLHTINRPRLLHILHTWLENYSEGKHNCLPSPETTNKHEPLLFGPAFISDYFPDGFRVSIGCSLNWALRKCNSSNQLDLYNAAIDTFKHDKYVLCCNLEKRQLHIVYRSGVTFQEELQAFITAFLTVKNYTTHNRKQAKTIPKNLMTTTTTTTATTTTAATAIAADYDIIREVKDIVKRELPGFLQGLKEQDWKDEKLHVGDGDWRLME